MPTVTHPGVQLRVLAGTAYGQTSPVAFPAPLFYVDVQLEAGAEIDLPSAYAERALYVVEGEVMAVGVTAVPRRMLAFTDGAAVRVRATQAARLVLFGGAALDGPRHLYWNFVASEQAMIEDAKRAWQAQTFPKVPGDDQEFIPLPT